MACALLEFGGCVAAWLYLVVAARAWFGLTSRCVWLAGYWLAGLSCALEVTGLWWLGLAGCGTPTT